jgi:hypothetical protein
VSIDIDCGTGYEHDIDYRTFDVRLRYNLIFFCLERGLNGGGAGMMGMCKQSITMSLIERRTR